MDQRIVVQLGGQSYAWNGQHWYGVSDYTIPPLSITSKLNAHLPKKENRTETHSFDPGDLLERAKNARDLQQFDEALQMARIALNNRKEPAAASVLCSILRRMGQPEEALQVSKDFKESGYAPLLTSRAASFCDVGQWREALDLIRQVLAVNGGGNEAYNVYHRIKQNASELFETSHRAE